MYMYIPAVSFFLVGPCSWQRSGGEHCICFLHPGGVCLLHGSSYAWFWSPRQNKCISRSNQVTTGELCLAFICCFEHIIFCFLSKSGILFLKAFNLTFRVSILKLHSLALQKLWIFIVQFKILKIYCKLDIYPLSGCLV